MSSRLVILDRDGVINHDSPDFIKSPAEWLPIDGSIEAIARLSNAGYEVAVATNQSGIGRGLLDKPTLNAIHERMAEQVKSAGGRLGKIAFCPHHPDDECDCRKPAPGLLKSLARQYGVPLDNVPVIGDSTRDAEAAMAVNARPILVATGNGSAAIEHFAKRGVEIEHHADLFAAVDALLGESTGNAGASS